MDHLACPVTRDHKAKSETLDSPALRVHAVGPAQLVPLDPLESPDSGDSEDLLGRQVNLVRLADRDQLDHEEREDQS